MSERDAAKALMPWLFKSRSSAAYKPFAKVRCEGGKCVWTSKESEPSRGRNSKRALAGAA
ncbi:MAG: hypothetical protein M0D55_06060 [Elusimicrobiota bacterium]|nr:MAG: hypothetical protein M0D55_06060 [Elusimicrobiota bacterium]